MNDEQPNVQFLAVCTAVSRRHVSPLDKHGLPLLYNDSRILQWETNKSAALAELNNLDEMKQGFAIGGLIFDASYGKAAQGRN